jgi:hypothetical protein
MSWMKKKDKKKPREEEQSDDDDFENETEDEEENQIRNIKQNVMKPVSQTQTPSDNLVIPFASPAREGLRTSDGKVFAEDIWTALAEIINRLNRIEKIISE